MSFAKNGLGIDEKKEMNRLKFMLDQANRYPDLLDTAQIKKFSLRLDELERKKSMMAK